MVTLPLAVKTAGLTSNALAPSPVNFTFADVTFFKETETVFASTAAFCSTVPKSTEVVFTLREGSVDSEQTSVRSSIARIAAVPS